MKVALVCIAKNEDNYIQEWIDYHFKLGFDSIFIYANDWEYKNNQNNVYIKNITGHKKQLEAYNNFKKEFNNEYNWVAFFDVDEFLVLHKHNNIKNFLSDYAECNAIGINWALFGNNKHESVVDNNFSVIERFTRRANAQKISHQSVDDWHEGLCPNSHVKSIVKLPCDKIQHVHNVDGLWFDTNKQKCTGAFNNNIDYSIAQLNHYFTKSNEELIIKCSRGRADTGQIRDPKKYEIYLNFNDVLDESAKNFMNKEKNIKKYTDVEGWFNYTNTYDFLVNNSEIGGIFVECGAWLGKSSLYLCEIAQNKLQIYIVDSWKGSKSELQTNHKLASQVDIYDIFLSNLEGYKFTAIKQFSTEASKNFKENSCDVVFIDMEHTYDSVKKDILTWLPKVKIGGYIAGHDYDNGWPGVIQAVNEVFDKNKIILMDTCWIVKREI